MRNQSKQSYTHESYDDDDLTEADLLQLVDGLDDHDFPDDMEVDLLILMEQQDPQVHNPRESTTTSKEKIISKTGRTTSEAQPAKSSTLKKGTGNIKQTAKKSGRAKKLPKPAAKAKRIIRHSFPEPVRDSSLIQGLSSATLSRTCFNIGEALLASSKASEDQDIFLELFARVKSASRNPHNIQQEFLFQDLFHDQKPFLEGVYTLWYGSDLWDAESQVFLSASGQQPRLCRAIGKVKRVDGRPIMTVLNIREASWEDVERAKSIVCA